MIADRAGSTRASDATFALLDDLLGGYRPRDFGVRLWDGSTWGPEPGRPELFTIVLRHPGALRRMFFPPGELSLAAAYTYGDYDIEARRERVPLADHLLDQRPRLRTRVCGPLAG